MNSGRKITINFTKNELLIYEIRVVDLKAGKQCHIYDLGRELVYESGLSKPGQSELQYRETTLHQV